MPAICDHGYYLTDCALCAKLPGECDYGSCQAPATTSVETRAHGRVCEIRPMCAHHARHAPITVNGENR
jgi:hypothetical protein